MAHKIHASTKTVVSKQQLWSMITYGNNDPDTLAIIQFRCHLIAICTL